MNTYYCIINDEGKFLCFNEKRHRYEFTISLKRALLYRDVNKAIDQSDKVSRLAKLHVMKLEYTLTNINAVYDPNDPDGIK